MRLQGTTQACNGHRIWGGGWGGRGRGAKGGSSGHTDFIFLTSCIPFLQRISSLVFILCLNAKLNNPAQRCHFCPGGLN